MPVAVNVAVPPTHIVAVVAVTAGEGETVTTAGCVMLQPFTVYVTVYVVVTVGFTVVLDPVAPVDQLYVPPAGLAVA